MNPLAPYNQPPYAYVQRIGIPRALLYYRYGILWTSFFEALGHQVIVSDPTDKAILARGDALSNDECCLASKIYLGHAATLASSCDALFVPSIANIGARCGFCTKFQALPDLVSNTFADQNVQVISCLVNETAEKLSMRDALLGLAVDLGEKPHAAKQAWREASRAQEHAERLALTTQTRKLSTLEIEREKSGDSGTAPVGILLAAHPYLSHDPFIGAGIVDILERMGAVVVFADEADHKRTLQASFEFSATLPWVINREIIGAITLLHERVDGIVLVSAFPCGPDSMTDDAIVRCIQGKPILNLTVDAQSGTAGLETRIESFIDILRYQKKGGYVHDSQ